MSQILICSTNFVITPGLPPSCPFPGVLSSVDISVFVGVSSTTIDPIIALQAFGSRLVIAGIPLLIALVGRIVVASIFKIGDAHV